MNEILYFPERGNELDKITVIKRKINIGLLLISFAGFAFNCTVYAMLHKIIWAGSDISAFISFISSVIILAAIFVIQNLCDGFAIINVVWFPYYFFLVLLLFSSIVLYLNKREAGRINE